MKTTHFAWSVVILAIAASVFAFSSAGIKSAASFAASQSQSSGQLTLPQASKESTDRLLVRRSLFHHVLREALGVLGDRLEKSGKERLTLTGTLSRSDTRETSSVLIVRQFPDKLRLEEQTGGRVKVITFDGSTARKAGGQPDTDEADLIETLAYDTAESFFAAQARGRTARFMGSRFRLDEGDGNADGQTVYDLYQITDEVAIGKGSRRRTKLYYFNSDTLLLERVRYEIERNGVPVRVEVLLGDWQKSEGQNVPRRIERTENGSLIFALTFNSPGFGPRADDQSFTAATAVV